MNLKMFAFAICIAAPAPLFAESHDLAGPNAGVPPSAVLDCTLPVNAVLPQCINIPAFEATNLATIALPVAGVVGVGVFGGIGNKNRGNNGRGNNGNGNNGNGNNGGGGGGGGNGGGGGVSTPTTP